MRASDRDRGVPAEHRLRLLSLLAMGALTVACSASTATPSPGAGSPAASPASATTTMPPTSTAPATASPTIAATEPLAPSATPQTTTTSSPAASAPRWETAADLMTGRLVAHAVVLEDGRVFVVGNDSMYDQGDITRDDTAKAEIWDPVADRWMVTGSLNKPRGAFALVTLARGRVLVAGGLNQGGSGCGSGTPQSFSSAYLFDPRTGHETWDRTGLLTTARTSPAIATLPDGRVLVAGGYFRIDQGMAVLTPDVIAGTAVTRSGGVGTATLAAFAPPLADVSVPPYGRALATAEIFDPATGEWSKTGSMRYARVGGVGVTLSDGRILVVGSSEDNAMVSDGAYTTSEIYDPATEAFSRSGSLPGIDRAALKRVGTPVPGYDPAPLDEGTLVALDDGGAVLIGQSGWWKHEGEITRSFRFDAAKGTWREIGTTWVAGWSNEEPYTDLEDPRDATPPRHDGQASGWTPARRRRQCGGHGGRRHPDAGGPTLRPRHQQVEQAPEDAGGKGRWHGRAARRRVRPHRRRVQRQGRRLGELRRRRRRPGVRRALRPLIPGSSLSAPRWSGRRARGRWAGRTRIPRTGGNRCSLRDPRRA